MNLDKKLIIEAIAAAEKRTSGEIRVHLQAKCSTDTLSDTKKVFHRLKMHKTKERNAVLIFVALDSHRFAVLGDAGIHKYVGESFWDDTRDAMNRYFREGKISEGIVAGVKSVGEALERNFPRKKMDRNELSDEVTES